MGKDYDKSRPKGAPEAPHPWSQSSHPDLDITDMTDFKDNIILKKLGEDIKGIQRDIDLNYRRLYYKNPMIPVLLKVAQEQLGAISDALTQIPEEFVSKEESKISFGMSKEDII